jgi:hypothetical protein
MSQASLNAIAIDVVGKYNEAAKNLVATYRFGTQRAVNGLNDRYVRILDGASSRLVNEGLKKTLLGAEQQFAGFVTDTVTRVSDRADDAIDTLHDRVVAGIQLVDEKTSWADDSTLFNAIRTLNMPAAKITLGIAGGVAQVSKRLSDRVAGAEPVEAEVVAKKAAKKVVKSAKKVTRRASAKR